MKLKKWKMWLSGSLAAMMVASACMPAFAATTTLKSVTIAMDEDEADPGMIRDAVPEARSSSYEITDWSCSHEYDDWNPGDKVTFYVTVEPAEGRKFSKSDTKVKVSGKNLEMISSKVTSSGITLKLNYWPSMKLENPENLMWSEDESWVAEWDKVEPSNAYEAKIIMTNYDGKTKSKTVTLSRPELDLSSYATDGEVTFSVRAIPKTKTQEKYLTPSDWVDMNDAAYPDYNNTVAGNFKEKNDTITFVTPDGSTASGWQYINDSWYYFNPANKNTMCETTWMHIDGNWYYFGPSGIMVSGWAKIGDHWYFLADNPHESNYGAMVKGWVTVGPGGPWYFLNDGTAPGYPEGACLMDTVTPDGYKVDKEGAWYPNR